MAQNKPTIAISVGDINGVGLEILLREHNFVRSLCRPIYCVHSAILDRAMELSGNHISISDEYISSPKGFNSALPHISVGCIDEVSGRYSFESFMHACDLADCKQAQAILTLPIHKESWHKAGIAFIGHTHALRERYNKEAIMMLGCEEMFVALFTEHIALSQVSKRIDTESLCSFLLRFAQCEKLAEPCAVLSLNPHCGDGGLMGNEDSIIASAIEATNATLQKQIFKGPYAPDSAFAPHNRAKFRYFVSMYHDVGLSVLKALHFEKSINVSLNLPIIRTSVDHGVAFDIAYRGIASTQSYKNALLYALKAIGTQ